MQRKHLLSITTLATDYSFNIVTSKKTELKGRNLIDLCAVKGVEFSKRLMRMKKGGVYQEELFMNLEESPKRYSVVVRKGTVKYVVVLIELEEVYELMENVALYRKYAFFDNLTGALTRHGYWNELFELLRYSEKLDYNIGIIFVDIDNLKKMNTELGYKGGDAQIAEISRTLQKSLRKNDLLVRLGGDEFLALLPIRSNQTESLRIIANRMLKYVRNNELLKTTISLGTQLLTPDMITEILNRKDVKAAWDKYLVLADEKVRQAKLSGKNTAIL